MGGGEGRWWIRFRIHKASRISEEPSAPSFSSIPWAKDPTRAADRPRGGKWWSGCGPLALLCRAPSKAWTPPSPARSPIWGITVRAHPKRCPAAWGCLPTPELPRSAGGDRSRLQARSSSGRAPCGCLGPGGAISKAPYRRAAAVLPLRCGDWQRSVHAPSRHPTSGW